MAKQQNLTSPKGAARWAHITKPNTKFNEAGVFSVELVVDPAEVEKLKPEFKRIADEFLAKKISETRDVKAQAKLKKLGLHLPIADDLDDQGNETGKVILKFKSNASYVDKKTNKKVDKRVHLFDAKGKPIDVLVGNGSTIRVSYFPRGYAMPATNSYGVTLDLRAVQVIDLVAYTGGGGNAEGYGFQAEEGYEGDAPSDIPGSEARDSTDAGSAGDGAGNDF